jgi:hypothetical protein
VGRVTARRPRVPDVVSLLLNPAALTGGFLVVLVRAFEPAGGRQWLVGGGAVLFTTLLPLGLLFVLKAKGQLSDIEMRVRTERTRVYLWCAGSYALGLAVVLALHAAWQLTALLALLLPTALILTVLNRWWKVSIHTSTLAGLATLGVALFGPGALWFALVVPLAGWARWAAGAHTTGEVFSGIALGSSSAVAGLALAHALGAR